MVQFVLQDDASIESEILLPRIPQVAVVSVQVDFSLPEIEIQPGVARLAFTVAGRQGIGAVQALVRVAFQHDVDVAGIALGIEPRRRGRIDLDLLDIVGAHAGQQLDYGAGGHIIDATVDHHHDPVFTADGDGVIPPVHHDAGRAFEHFQCRAAGRGDGIGHVDHQVVYLGFEQRLLGHHLHFAELGGIFP